MDSDRLTTVAGFAGALTVLAVVLWVIGVDDVLTALGEADTRVVPVIVVVAAVWLSAWGMALWTVLRAIGTPVSAPKAVFVFAAAIFSNNITPFGQAGGEPVSALLISSVADSEYEDGLAAIASVDALNFVPSVGFAVVGFVYLLAGAAQLTRDIVVAAGGVVVLVALIVTAGTVGWHHRQRVEAAVARAVTPLLRLLARVVPGRTPPDRDAVEHRIDGFFDAVTLVATDRRTLLTALGFSTLGWFALAVSLWLSLYSLGYVVPFSATLFVIPVGAIAGVTPLPGGLGGMEAVFITLLVPTAGVPASAATAAVLIHRGATYWLPTLVGGGAAAVIGTQNRDTEPGGD